MKVPLIKVIAILVAATIGLFVKPPDVNKPVYKASKHLVVVSWTASQTPGVSYYVYRSKNGGPFVRIGNIKQSPFTDGSVANGSYQYYITAYIKKAEAVPSNIVPITIP